MYVANQGKMKQFQNKSEFFSRLFDDFFRQQALYDRAVDCARFYFAQYANGEPEAQRRRIAAGACSDLMVISKPQARSGSTKFAESMNFSLIMLRCRCKIAVICDAERWARRPRMRF
jgi:hypothetical protein